jgi:hypothetical protein
MRAEKSRLTAGGSDREKEVKRERTSERARAEGLQGRRHEDGWSDFGMRWVGDTVDGLRLARVIELLRRNQACWAP